MNETFILKQIQRSNRNLKILCTILLVGTCIALGAFQNYYYNFFFGPFPLPYAKLHPENPEKRDRQVFVTLDSQAIINLGYKEIEETKKYGKVISTKDLAYYFAADTSALPQLSLPTQNIPQQTNDGIQNVPFILVKFDANDPRVKGHFDDEESTLHLSKQEQSITGELVPIPADVKSYLDTNSIRSLHYFNNSILMLDATDYRTNGYIGLSLGAMVVGLSIFGLVMARRRSKDPTQHPIGRYLNRIGNLEQLTSSIEAELQKMQGLGSQVGSIMITKSWVFKPYLFGLKIVYLPEIIWVYQRVVQHRHNGIPAGKHFSIVFWDRRGIKVELSCRKKQVGPVLAILLQQIPWAVFGYDKSLEVQMKTDREEIIAVVEQRKKVPSG